MADELKPCPLCGREPEPVVNVDGTRVWVRIVCNYCGASTGEHRANDTGECQEAVDEWSTRPIEDALRAEVVELKCEAAMLKESTEQYRAEVAALKAELAAAKTAEGEAMLVVESQDISIEKLKVKLKEYAEPLTDEQARAVLMVERKRTGHSAEDIVMEWDAATREVRSK